MLEVAIIVEINSLVPRREMDQKIIDTILRFVTSILGAGHTASILRQYQYGLQVRSTHSCRRDSTTNIDLQSHPTVGVHQKLLSPSR